MILLQLLKEAGSKDASLHFRNFSRLVDLAGYLIEAPHEARTRELEWLTYSEKLGFKIAYHTMSMKSLLEGYSFSNAYNKELSGKVVDLQSANVLLRALIETCLTFRMIYDWGRDAEEKEFAFSCWMYAGLRSRQSHDAFIPEAQAQKLRDQKAIASLRKRIEELAGHQQLVTDGQLGTILDGKSQQAGRLLLSWKDLAKRLGYQGPLSFEGIYHLLSRDAHTDSLSILRLKDANPVDNNENRCFILLHGCLWVSEFIAAWVRLHKSAELKFNTAEQDLIERVRLYSRLLTSKNPST